MYKVTHSGRIRLLGLFLMTLICVIAVPAIAHPPQTAQPVLLAQSPSLLEQGKTYYQTGKFAEAIQTLQNAVQAYSNDWPNQASALNNLGVVYFETGKVEKALKYWRQAEPAYQKAGDRLGVLRCRIQQVQAHQALGELTRALDILTELKQQTDAQPASLEKVQILRLMGDVLLAIGGGDNPSPSPSQSDSDIPPYLQRSEAVLQESLELAKPLNTPEEISAANMNLGNLRYAALRANIRIEITNQKYPDKQDDLDQKVKVLPKLELQADKARQYYDQGKIADQPSTIVRSQMGQLNVLLSQGNVYSHLLDQEAGLTPGLEAGLPLEEKRQLQFKLNQTSREIGTLTSEIAAQLKDLPLNRAGVYTRINFVDQLSDLWKMSELWKNHQLEPLPTIPSLSEAANILAGAIHQSRQLGDLRAEAYALGALSRLYEKTGQGQKAEQLTRQAISLGQTTNAPDISFKLQYQLARALERDLDQLNRDFNDSKKVENDSKKVEADKLYKEATIAYKNTIQTLDTLRTSLVAVNSDVQFDFRDSVEPIYRDYIRLLLSQNKTHPQPSQADLKEARDQVENLQLAELDNFFREACLTGRKDSIDNQIDQNQANAKTAVIYPIILSKRELAVIAKLPKQPNLYYARVGSDKITEDIDVTLSQFQQNLRSPDPFKQDKALGQVIYNWLFSTDLHRPGEKNRVDTSMGKDYGKGFNNLREALEVHQVDTLVFVLDGAFRSVPMAALYDGSGYLIQRAAIAVSPGLQLTAPEKTSKRRLQVLAGGLNKLAHKYPQPDGQPFKEIEGSVEQLNRLRDLKVLTAELQEQEFSSANFQQRVKTLDFNVIHLVTHGIFSSRLEDTFILMADQDTNGRINAKRFSDILQSRGQTTADVIDLLVLSACQTAQGDDRAALGLAGIAMRSGARSTIAGLWGVYDDAAVSLFNKFYPFLKEKQLTKAQALQEAQKAMIQQGDLADRWAPFILVGSWL